MPVHGCVQCWNSLHALVNSFVFQIPASKRLKAYDSDSERGSDGGAPKKIPRVSTGALET